MDDRHLWRQTALADNVVDNLDRLVDFAGIDGANTATAWPTARDPPLRVECNAHVWSREQRREVSNLVGETGATAL